MGALGCPLQMEPSPALPGGPRRCTAQGDHPAGSQTSPVCPPCRSCPAAAGNCTANSCLIPLQLLSAKKDPEQIPKRSRWEAERALSEGHFLGNSLPAPQTPPNQGRQGAVLDVRVLLRSHGGKKPRCLVPRLRARGSDLSTSTSLAISRHPLTAAGATPIPSAAGTWLGCDSQSGDQGEWQSSEEEGQRRKAQGGRTERGRAHLQDAFVLPLPVLKHQVACQEDVTFLAHAVQAVPVIL